MKWLYGIALVLALLNVGLSLWAHDLHDALAWLVASFAWCVCLLKEMKHE